MKRAIIRSLLFNLAFFCVTAALCVVYIPALLLPRPVYTGLVRLWIYIVTTLEYLIMGIRYEIRGREFLPESGSYIVAAKHQSEYETIKLRLLFRDPAIILKKELLKIPLWGAYLKKSGVIAIDRSTPERALKSIEEGAVKMMEAGRPIVIFVQGTRVLPNESPFDKPYKSGVARIQQATNLPIIPMALNSGIFWPRGNWLKSPGKVVFEFFAPVQPGLERKELLHKLEDKIESESNRLMNEARATELTHNVSSIKSILLKIIFCALLFAGYSYLWQETAKRVREAYISFEIADSERIHADPVISGFPWPIKMRVAEDFLNANNDSLKIENIVVTGWPFPFIPIRLETGLITVKSHKWSEALVFDKLEARATFLNNILNLKDSSLRRGDFEGKASGLIDLTEYPYPGFDVTLTMEHFAEFLGYLAQIHILEDREALFMTAGFSMLARDGVVSVPITRNGPTLYAGPLPIASLPGEFRPDEDLPEPGNPPDQYQ